MLLVAIALLLKLAQFEMSVINFFLQGVPGVRFLCDVSLGGKNFGLSSGYLFSCGSDLTLQVVVATVLFIKEESSIVDFFAQHVEGAGVGVMTLLEVVVLEQLFILQMTVLCLNGVELVSKC